MVFLCEKISFTQISCACNTVQGLGLEEEIIHPRYYKIFMHFFKSTVHVITGQYIHHEHYFLLRWIQFPILKLILPSHQSTSFRFNLSSNRPTSVDNYLRLHPPCIKSTCFSSHSSSIPLYLSTASSALAAGSSWISSCAQFESLSQLQPPIALIELCFDV